MSGRPKVSLADLPASIAAIASEPSAATNVIPLNVARDADSVIPEGERNVRLTSMVGAWFAAGHDQAKVLDLALNMNTGRCQPPLPIREVEGIVKSIARREAKSQPYGRPRMEGLNRYTVNVDFWLFGPASDLDRVTFGALVTLYCEAWKRTGLPADMEDCVRLAREDTPAIRKAIEDFFPMGADGRRTDVDQEIERVRFEHIRHEKVAAGRRGGLAKAANDAEKKRSA